MSYQPAVTQEEGTSMVFTKRGSRWVLHEGTIKYVSPYSGLWITEYWRGYLQFDGQPSVTSQLHGVMYQWGYAFGVDEPTVKSFYTNAVWDAVMEAWLLGFSVYLWDDRSAPQNYIGASGPILPTYGFPDPFIEPVPASNCNPMSL